MLLLLNSDYGAMKNTLKLNRFLAKVWASRHIKFIPTPYSRKNCAKTKIYDVDLRLLIYWHWKQG